MAKEHYMSKVSISKLGTAVITGASSGIGKVYADRLAARGYDLLLVARRADRLQAIAHDLQSLYSVHVEYLVADLASPIGLSETIQKITADPSITLLVNNAGTVFFGPIETTSQATLTTMVALNVTALTALTMAVLTTFQKRNSGTIINIGSVGGFSGLSILAVYGGTKAYVLNFTQALQKQLSGTGIRVQLVTPAATATEIWDTAGFPISNVDPATVMSTEDCVDASLQGLDAGELITAPALEDEGVLRSFEAASEALFNATQTGQAASRYGLKR
jgi:short-subunit dehydrogenase